MSVETTAQTYLCRLPGGSASLLLLDHQTRSWVVKFKHNPQHRRVLINEHLAASLGTEIGLSMPTYGRVHVNEQLAELIRSDSACCGPSLQSVYSEGVHFGSMYAGGLLPGLVLGSQDHLQNVVNRSELAGIYALDVWLNNADRRQMVFVRKSRRSQLRAIWVDQGHCFGGCEWLIDRPLRRFAYSHLSRSICLDLRKQVWEWIARIQRIPLPRFYDLLKELPPAWIEDDAEALISMLERVFRRQTFLESLVCEALRLDVPVE